MIYLQYVGEDKKHVVEFQKINKHIVQIKGSIPVKINGFTCTRTEVDDDAWDYTQFTTVYREIEGGVQYSDDGSVYVPPIITQPEESEPYVPTLEEEKEIKKQEIKSVYTVAKAAGIDVELSTGIEHFPLTDEDITFLMGKQFELVSSDEAVIPYQNSESRCKFYSREDMQLIIQRALQFVNYQTTYRNNLCEWVDECQTKDEVQEIVYGNAIPEKYQNDVLKSYLLQMGGTANEDI